MSHLSGWCLQRIQQILGPLPSLCSAVVFKPRAALTNTAEVDSQHSGTPSKQLVYIFPKNLYSGLKGAQKSEQVRGFLLLGSLQGRGPCQTRARGDPAVLTVRRGGGFCCCSAPQTASSADLFHSALRLNTAVTSAATAQLVIAVTRLQICPNL